MIAARLAFAACFVLLATGAARSAVPAQVVGIKLQDPSTDPAIKQMQITLDHDAVKPGRVTLKAENLSKSLVHEVLVVRYDKSAMPYDAQHDLVDEKRVHSLGEISELPAGKSGTLTLNLKPGTYLLFCNQPGHYKAGMATKLSVTR